MEWLRVAEGGKCSPKREIMRSSRNRRNMNVLESIAQVKGGSVVSHTNEGGVVRMKLVVRKQDLGQMLQLMRNGNGNSCSVVEQRLKALRRKHHSRSNMSKYWSPALQSIPEDLCY